MMQAQANAPLLLAADVGYAYHTQPVIHGISFEVWPGELVALVGRNGAGKSTLLRCLAGWMPVTDGKVRILGLSVGEAERAVRRHAIFVPDVPSFYDELTAWEHLQFVAQAHRLAGWQGRASELMERFGLWRDRGTYPFTFSRGMRYKLAVCLALTVEPQLLLMDEPFASLDPLSARFMWEVLVRRCREGMGALLSSHQLPPQCEPDRYLVLEEGALVAQGTPAELGATGSLALDALLRAAGAWEAGQDDA